MAQNVAGPSVLGAGTIGGMGAIEPSLRNALAHFLPLAPFVHG